MFLRLKRRRSAGRSETGLPLSARKTGRESGSSERNRKLRSEPIVSSRSASGESANIESSSNAKRPLRENVSGCSKRRRNAVIGLPGRTVSGRRD